MPLSREGGRIYTERPRCPVPFVSSPSSGCIELIVEVELMDVQFVWVDSDDRTISFMQASNMEGILPAQNDIVVELVPKGELVCVLLANFELCFLPKGGRCQSRAWKSPYRTEEKSVDD